MNPTLDELKNLPTIHSGQFSDLKSETDDTRIWLSRSTTEDGEPYDNKVTIEHFDDGNLTTTEEYQAS
ncbi:MAG: hypothetical protein AV945_gp41 [Phormidium phage MIS-PhV1B]|jgi:hypothetical protein|uniref:hypothetical protein n=1 Tax=Phormidium phage MIS-PhV1B TaxID=1391456 RepID=UPI0003C98F85|nr:MAG: hypothetical protein AV945_gp41 [Phormidium phage MIS-PhV1B]AGZ61848.1 MAG: hypothetical protein [Phormidium phage MIS-PhV1B]